MARKNYQANVVLIAANTEYSYDIPPNAMEISLQLRPLGDNAKLFYYFVTGGRPIPATGAGIYTTLQGGQSSTKIYLQNSQTIYFQSDTAGQSVEIDYKLPN